jgi:hypothetical protein
LKKKRQKWELSTSTFSIPTSYFIDTKGVIQDKFIGPMTQKEMEKRVAKLTT